MHRCGREHFGRYLGAVLFDIRGGRCFSLRVLGHRLCSRGRTPLPQGAHERRLATVPRPLFCLTCRVYVLSMNVAKKGSSVRDVPHSPFVARFFLLVLFRTHSRLRSHLYLFPPTQHNKLKGLACKTSLSKRAVTRASETTTRRPGVSPFLAWARFGVGEL